jgi:hypothetical protein
MLSNENLNPKAVRFKSISYKRIKISCSILNVEFKVH